MRFNNTAFGLFLAILLVAAPAFGEESSRAERSSKKTKTSEELVDTPFGKVKKRDAKPRAGRSRAAAFVEITEKGDEVTFRRKTPFGMQSWTRSRSELSDDEQRLMREHKEAREEAAEAEKTETDTTAADPQP